MRIRNYPKNTNLTEQDMLLGTDSYGLTKNFLLSDITRFVTSGISLSGATIIVSADSSQISATRIGYGTVTNQEFSYLDGVSANIQQQINNISFTGTTQGFSGDYLPLSGGTLTGNIKGQIISATTFVDTTFLGSRVLVSNGNSIEESNTNSTTLSYLSGISADIQSQLVTISALDNQKALKNITVSAGNGLNGGGSLSANLTISLAPTGTSGIYDKVVVNAYGQVTSGRTTTSADVPQLPPSKISTDSSNRFVSDSQINYWNSLSANQTSGVTSGGNFDFSAAMNQELLKNNYTLISASVTVLSSSPTDENATKQLSVMYSGNRLKKYTVTGPTSGDYLATVTFMGTDINRTPWNYPDNCIVAAIDNNTNSIEATFENDLLVWSASVDISGSPNGFIVAKVEV